MKRLIALRKRYDALRPRRPGVPAPREPARARLPAQRRATSSVLVVANLSRFAQYVELDLSRFKGARAAGALRPDALPADRRAALPAHARAARLLLARPSRAPRDEPERDRRPRHPGHRGQRLHRRARHRAAPGPSSSARSPASCPGAAGSRGKARTIRNVAITDCIPLTGGALAAGRPRADREGGVQRGRGRDLLACRCRWSRASAPRTCSSTRPRSVVTRIYRRGDSAVIAEGADRPRGLPGVPRGRCAAGARCKGSSGGRLAGRPTPALRAALNGAGAARARRSSGPSRATRRCSSARA